MEYIQVQKDSNGKRLIQIHEIFCITIQDKCWSAKRFHKMYLWLSLRMAWITRAYITMHGMWSIEDQSFSQLLRSRGQSLISRKETIGGNPSWGKESILWQSFIFNSSRDVRFLSHGERDFKLGCFIKWSDSIVEGRSHSGNVSLSRQKPLILSFLSEFSLCRPHSENGFMFLQSLMSNETRLIGMPSPGKDAIMGQLDNLSSSRDVRLSIRFVRNLRLSQLRICIFFNLVEGRPCSGKDSILGQPSTSK